MQVSYIEIFVYAFLSRPLDANEFIYTTYSTGVFTLITVFH